eukprot:gene48751-66189_t
MSYLNDAGSVPDHKAGPTEGTKMPLSPLRVLIAENQYLIAMEVERILMEILSCNVLIVSVAKLGTALAERPFDIVILEAAHAEKVNVTHTAAIEGAGAVPVFLTSYDLATP